MERRTDPEPEVDTHTAAQHRQCIREGFVKCGHEGCPMAEGPAIRRAAREALEEVREVEAAERARIRRREERTVFDLRSVLREVF